MPLDLMTLSLVSQPVSLEEGVKIGARSLSLPVLRTRRPGQLRQCLGHVGRLRRPARPQRQKGPAESRRLLPRLQHDQRPQSVSQLRRSKSLRPPIPRRAAQNLGNKDASESFAGQTRCSRSQSRASIAQPRTIAASRDLNIGAARVEK